LWISLDSRFFSNSATVTFLPSAGILNGQRQIALGESIISIRLPDIFYQKNTAFVPFAPPFTSGKLSTMWDDSAISPQPCHCPIFIPIV